MPQPTAPPPIPDINSLIDDYIARKHRGIEELLKRGRFGYPGEGSGGPLTPRVTITTEGIEVETPTNDQWQVRVDWHTYNRTYGYKQDDLPADAPPPPPKPQNSRTPTVLVKWKTIQDRYAQAACGQDMLF
jgi:hypothetical protein